MQGDRDIQRGHYVEILIDDRPEAWGTVVNITPAFTRVKVMLIASPEPPLLDLWSADTGEKYIDVRRSGRVAMRRLK